MDATPAVTPVTAETAERVGLQLTSLIDELYPDEHARDLFKQGWSADAIAERAECMGLSFTAQDGAGRMEGVLLGAGLEGGVATVIWLGISPTARGKGFGRALLDEFHRAVRSKGGHKVKLFCNTQDAKAFYQKCGYTVEGFHSAHWWRMDCWSLGFVIDQKLRD